MSQLKNRQELAKYFAEQGFSNGAEIGVLAGYYSKMLLDNIPGLTLYGIDPWSNVYGSTKYGRRYGHRKMYLAHRHAQTLLAEYVKSKKFIIIQKSSLDALQDIEDNSLDFVFIDANHEHDPVLADIRGWAPKVRAGGIVSGHDYYVFSYTGSRGVVDAVDEYVRTHEVELLTTSWDKDNLWEDDRQPSWYFFKK